LIPVFLLPSFLLFACRISPFNDVPHFYFLLYISGFHLYSTMTSSPNSISHSQGHSSSKLFALKLVGKVTRLFSVGEKFRRVVNGARSGLRAAALQVRALSTAKNLSELRTQLLRKELERIRAERNHLFVENMRLTGDMARLLDAYQAKEQSTK
jgi:hypothetical protein